MQCKPPRNHIFFKGKCNCVSVYGLGTGNQGKCGAETGISACRDGVGAMLHPGGSRVYSMDMTTFSPLA